MRCSCRRAGTSASGHCQHPCGQPQPASRHLERGAFHRLKRNGARRALARPYLDDIAARDKASLDIFWLKDDSLADSDNLPAPGVIEQESLEDLQAALEQFKLMAGDLGVELPSVRLSSVSPRKALPNPSSQKKREPAASPSLNLLKD
jgi:hypothetical protein